jgi:hypothetical protein
VIDPCSEYPKAAYRLGGECDIWGRMMDMRSLVDSTDEAEALSDGWYLHPNDVPDEEEGDAPKRRGRPPKVSAE